MSDSEVKKDTVIDVVEPPPPFTPYEAEYSETDDGDIISHDAHLNQDGMSSNCLPFESMGLTNLV